MRALSVLLLAALLLSGCSDGPAAPDPQTSSDEPLAHDPPTRVVYTQAGTVTAGVGSPVVSFTSGADQIDFEMPSGITLLFVELRWSSPVQSLDLCLHAPADGDTQGVPNCGVVGDGGPPGMPAGLVQLTVQNPPAGDGWTVMTYAKGINADQDYELAATLFRGEAAVPSGYTAFA